MFAVGDSLFNEEENKTGWDKGHGKDDTDGHNQLRCTADTMMADRKKKSSC